MKLILQMTLCIKGYNTGCKFYMEIRDLKSSQEPEVQFVKVICMHPDLV